MNAAELAQSPVHFRQAHQPVLAHVLEDVSLTALDRLNRIKVMASLLSENLRSAGPEQVHLYNVRSVVELIALTADEASNDVSVSLERNGLPGCVESILEAQAQPAAAGAAPTTVSV